MTYLAVHPTLSIVCCAVHCPTKHCSSVPPTHLTPNFFHIQTPTILFQTHPNTRHFIPNALHRSDKQGLAPQPPAGVAQPHSPIPWEVEDPHSFLQWAQYCEAQYNAALYGACCELNCGTCCDPNPQAPKLPQGDTLWEVENLEDYMAWCSQQAGQYSAQFGHAHQGQSPPPDEEEVLIPQESPPDEQEVPIAPLVEGPEIIGFPLNPTAKEREIASILQGVALALSVNPLWANYCIDFVCTREMWGTSQSIRKPQQRVSFTCRNCQETHFHLTLAALRVDSIDRVAEVCRDPSCPPFPFVLRSIQKDMDKQLTKKSKTNTTAAPPVYMEPYDALATYKYYHQRLLNMSATMFDIRLRPVYTCLHHDQQDVYPQRHSKALGTVLGAGRSGSNQAVDWQARCLGCATFLLYEKILQDPLISTPGVPKKNAVYQLNTTRGELGAMLQHADDTSRVFTPDRVYISLLCLNDPDHKAFSVPVPHKPLCADRCMRCFERSLFSDWAGNVAKSGRTPFLYNTQLTIRSKAKPTVVGKFSKGGVTSMPNPLDRFRTHSVDQLDENGNVCDVWVFSYSFHSLFSFDDPYQCLRAETLVLKALEAWSTPEGEEMVMSPFNTTFYKNTMGSPKVQHSAGGLHTETFGLDTGGDYDHDLLWAQVYTKVIEDLVNKGLCKKLDHTQFEKRKGQETADFVDLESFDNLWARWAQRAAGNEGD